jgi:DNA-binding IclR family transcriptional regulator
MAVADIVAGQREASRSGMVDRAFSVLGAFNERDPALTLTAIAGRAGLPVNTTLRIVRSLMAAGALERREDGLYVVGLRLFEIAALAPRSHGFRRVAMPALEDLHAVTEQHVLLTVREGDEAVLVERLSARGADSVDYRIGGRLPLDGTGGGLILLAFAPVDVQERLLASAAANPSATWSVGGDLRRRLAAIRREEVLVATRRVSDGLSTVAAPLFGADGSVVAAVSVVTPRSGGALQALVPVVRTVARSVSRDLRAQRL